MNVNDFFKHPIVTGLLLPVITTILTIKITEYWNSKTTGTQSTPQVPKQAAKIPAQSTVTVEQPQEVTTL